MSKLTVYLMIIASSLFFASCQKEIGQEQTGNNSDSILGDYKFISIETKSVVSVLVRDGGDEARTVTNSHYITKENKGTIKIDAEMFRGNGLAYSVDTTIRIQSYFNGVKEEDEEMPFSFSFPPTSSSAPYKKIGSDSLYFTTGSMLIGNTPQQPSTPNGVKYRLEGNKLLLTQNLNATKSDRIDDLTYSTLTQGAVVITLERL